MGLIKWNPIDEMQQSQELHERFGVEEKLEWYAGTMATCDHRWHDGSDATEPGAVLISWRCRRCGHAEF